MTTIKLFLCLFYLQPIIIYGMIDFHEEYKKLEQQKQAIEKQALQVQISIAHLNSNRDQELFAVAAWLGLSAVVSTVSAHGRAMNITLFIGIGLGIGGLLQFQKKSFNVYEQASRKVQTDLQLAQAELRGAYVLLEQLKSRVQTSTDMQHRPIISANQNMQTVP